MPQGKLYLKGGGGDPNLKATPTNPTQPLEESPADLSGHGPDLDTLQSCFKEEGVQLAIEPRAVSHKSECRRWLSDGLAVPLKRTRSLGASEASW